MQTETAPTVKKGGKTIAIILAVVLVFGAMFTLLLMMYQNENSSNAVTYMPDESAKSGYIQVYAKTYSVDPVKGELSTRLQFTPMGDLDQNGSLTKNVTLYLNSSTGKTQIPFKKGELMNPTDAVIDIYGNIGAYPFDSHDGMLMISMETDVTDAQGKVTDTEAVPFTVEYSAQLAGYSISSELDKDSESGYGLLDFNVSRAPTALTFAIFIMVLEWLLALTAAGATFMWLKGRKIEVSMFGWMGALLFALVPLRNAMPAVPPVGVLSDIIAFFWAEILVALCLVVSVVTWFRRGSAEGKAK